MQVLWRQKEQFSDGVGYGWIDYLKKHAENAVTDEMMKNVKTPVSDPNTFFKKRILTTVKSLMVISQVPLQR